LAIGYEAKRSPTTSPLSSIEPPPIRVDLTPEPITATARLLVTFALLQ
jgi:hypothetical protein